MTPPQVPLSRTRAQRFDDLVLDAVERLDQRWQDRLRSVEFAVEEVPPVDPWRDPDDPVPFSRHVPAGPGRPARVVVYRRPLEARADDADDLAALVHDVVVEEVANLLGIDPQTIDPTWND